MPKLRFQEGPWNGVELVAPIAPEFIDLAMADVDNEGMPNHHIFVYTKAQEMWKEADVVGYLPATFES